MTPPVRPAPRSLLPLVAVAAISGLLGGLGGGALVATTGVGAAGERADAVADGGTRAVPADLPLTTAAPGGGSIAELSSAVLPSVALISIGEDGDVGQGSGFVIREDGYLLTNHHVVAEAEGEELVVHLPGRQPMPAEVVGSDSTYDIAVVKVEAKDLPALELADRDEVMVGQTVVAVGAPLGLDSTVTSGIVSALDRPVVTGDAEDASYISAIQTDAAINPGNSGGPLLDLSGRVVGVNSAIAQVPSGLQAPSGSIGLGFAIPGEQAGRTATQLIETGRSQHPIIGAHIDTQYTGDGARVLPEAVEGVEPVVPGGPAAAAGVRAGDVILAVDGVAVRDTEHLLVLLRSHAVGDTVELDLRRGEQKVSVDVVLGGSED